MVSFRKRGDLHGQVKKILAGVLVVVIAGSGITAGLMQLKKNSQKTGAKIMRRTVNLFGVFMRYVLPSGLNHFADQS